MVKILVHCQLCFAGLESLGGDCHIPDPKRGFAGTLWVPLRAGGEDLNWQNFVDTVLGGGDPSYRGQKGDSTTVRQGTGLTSCLTGSLSTVLLPHWSAGYRGTNTISSNADLSPSSPAFVEVGLSIPNSIPPDWATTFSPSLGQKIRIFARLQSARSPV